MDTPPSIGEYHMVPGHSCPCATRLQFQGPLAKINEFPDDLDIQKGPLSQSVQNDQI